MRQVVAHILVHNYAYKNFAVRESVYLGSKRNGHTHRRVIIEPSKTPTKSVCL